jgi:hypothetical protein
MVTASQAATSKAVDGLYREMQEAFEQVRLNCYESDSFALRRLIDSWDAYQADMTRLDYVLWWIAILVLSSFLVWVIVVH